ncbi:beta and beta-prime subunits of DNA dependent RNA-polymerase [Rickenella mellea]|uniref:DNA-directed RNA polymerase subunit n=1 Tax=Rickenella mellea TaxID=50990 RepID=A0A4V3AZM3_9AGAM|nr:beta and beta-prime subunits of DNA dependent RNA-polymerase [Rickenella mellea]
MNIAHSIPSTISSVSFSFLSTQDIRRISVKQIVNPILLDDLNRPNIGGLYDPFLGPTDHKDICATCHLNYYTCPGHFGHIDLPSPVFHPLFMTNMYNILRGTCLFCHRFKMSRTVKAKFAAKLRLLERGLLEAANMIDSMHIHVVKSAEGDDSEAESPEDETPAQYEARLNVFVQMVTMRAGVPNRDQYKDGQVYQARKEVIADFIRSTVLKKCQNLGCNAHGYTFRKEGHTKIIEYDLSTKQKAQHVAMNMKRPDVLLLERQQRVLQAGQSGNHATSNMLDSDPDSDSDDGESEHGEPVDSRSESDGESENSGSGDLPRAANGKVKTKRGRNERVMPPKECRAHLHKLFSNERILCSLLFGRHGHFSSQSLDGLSLASADMFFLEVLPVSPTRFRPPATLGETLFEHPQNELLSKVLNTSYKLRDINDELNAANSDKVVYDEVAKKKLTTQLLDALIQLQIDVNSFVDSSKNPAPVRQGKLPPQGVKQGLEKKEGLFRKNMMGKRVNFAARSVISPDVNIEPNEIGIPPVFARKLTFPEPVTHHNVHDMRQLVINGPNEYPGATIVEYEDGSLRSLAKTSLDERKAIANQLLTPQDGNKGAKLRTGLTTRTLSVNKKVHRHLQDGDILILNRQPTLHKPSMMAHKARVLQGEKTIRMHYANCNSYNADFDGDEMNIHFPQNEIARAEAMFIANTDNQYLVPTSGNPLRGLIQDHVVAGVWMTSRDAFFTREEYQQLLYGSIRPEEDLYHNKRLVTIPPVIWKPKPLWTGKQIISTVLLNITPNNAQGMNLESKSKVSGDLWGKHSEEGTVIVMDGELLCGILDKSQFGATDYGLVHSVYELYGALIAGQLLGILSRLFTKFLQHRAFTCRMDDLTLTPEGDMRRKQLLNKGRNLGVEGAMENFPSLSTLPTSEKSHSLTALLQEILRDDSKMAGLDVTVKQKLTRLTKSIADACMPGGLMRKFPHNHMQAMTQSGAKGSGVNAQQISCALGQQELEGRRVPVMVSGKTLPSFKAFETAAIAGGYVASRFLTGVKPQEFYFHCMAGREGLIDTAVKTSRSGYLQRCLIKHMEGIRVHYDHTVRGSDSSVYQFHYGGDSLDVTKQKHLYQFDFAARNETSLVNRYKPKRVIGIVNEDEASKYMKRALKKKAKGGNILPVLAEFSPSRFLGATSEKFAEEVDKYVKENRHGLIKSKDADSKSVIPSRKELIPAKRFRNLMNVKYMRSLVDPGEAVGLLAAQGVGEPSTQMTLNTFHFAGHGAANVTLGIPRLREIVMTASIKPKTPSMKLKVRPGTSGTDVDAFCKKASRLCLSQVVEKVTVKERLSKTRRKEFVVDLSFYPSNEYQQEYDISTEELLSAFGTKFPLILKKEIQTELRKLSFDIKSQLTDLGKGRVDREATTRTQGDDDDEPPPRQDNEGSEVGDGDADDEKRARQSKQQATYESDEESESGSVGGEDVATGAERQEANPENLGGDPLQGEDSLEAQIQETGDKFLNNLPLASSFEFTESNASIELQFGSDTPKLLLVGIVERVCRKTIVREIPGIVDCFPVLEAAIQGRKGIPTEVVTNGSNFHGMWEFTASFGGNLVQVNEIYSNDIYASLRTYGVEMARAVILEEIKGVFKAYKIDVNIRHLELIADYMTFDGGYKPFNRKGISTSSSPLLKASYETTAAFLSDATLHGDYDDLTSPSGNIVLGRPSLSGTGVFDIVQPLA